ncbi:small nucleolar RNP protein, Gar1 protein RNA binding region, putative [Perkinsus marinus ATCC 50983]|uniref:H/ACA ribonucleoprotein complex subunit n=1 Tax=Perkinsus marinus (strain ATCC 50983 / TXsc) TaxID=423536 RepID=C5KX11_PERM5|nr:small nucleolar RNP protein, Gar1 protein RNA binding region, putative [Perkinsus marinus ATCC 50983]EER11015.1 small nucleolar RNP protein, Gar1 protein RNA binding region, putative [Perkinsus marinus ATCC 50983]|eukprot:XP_002779220.1 small nucleolar RNP protein, Gar1 protein RNA binding region, putative [Perkinsus marinus ATCC 50983]
MINFGDIMNGSAGAAVNCIENIRIDNHILDALFSKGHRAPLGPPEWVEELGEMIHVCEDEMICEVPTLKSLTSMDVCSSRTKSQIGQVDEILGPINEFYFSVKMQDGVVARSFKTGQKVYIDGNQTLPLERFLPVKKSIGPKKHAAGGKGKGGKGKGGKGKGFGKGKGKGKGHFGKGKGKGRW